MAKLSKKEKAELRELEASCLDEDGAIKNGTLSSVASRLAALRNKRDAGSLPNIPKEDIPPMPPAKPAIDEVKPELSEKDKLVADGWEWLGTNGHANFYYDPTGRAFVSGKNGLQCVGNKFGKKLLESLKK